MATCEEFLRLYQLCQTAKRCQGQDCPDVSNEVMEQARALDEIAAVRPQDCHTAAHDCYGCYDCQAMLTALSGLQARLSACGIELPAGLLEGSPGLTSHS